MDRDFLLPVIIPIICAAAFIRREEWLGMAAHIAGSVVMIGAIAAGIWSLRSQWSPEQAEA